MDYVVETFLVPLLFILMLFDYMNSKLDHWFRRLIPGPEPNVVFGNMRDIVIKRKSLVKKVEELCREWKAEPYFGIFVWHTPVLIINDLNVIKNILIDNSKLFSVPKLVINRGIIHRSSYKFGSIDHSEVLDRILTPDRMKNMFDFMIKSMNEPNLLKIIEDNEIINCSAFAKNFTSEIMSSCVFGTDENRSLREGRKLRAVIRSICGYHDCNPWEKKIKTILGIIYNYLGVKENSKMWEFFVGAIREKIKLRREDNILYQDFIDVFRDPKNKIHENDFEWSDSLLAAQASFFLISSYNPAISLISSALYELAINPDVQERLRAEIIETLSLCNELSYDIVKGMGYISMVLNETLRKHPMKPLIRRKLRENCQVEASNINIQKNTRIIIPVVSIHNDKEYYKDPDTFSPERFSEEEIKRRHPMTFLPYEGGPTRSIGENFAILSTKLALIFLLKKYRVNLVENNSSNFINLRKFQLKVVSLK